MQFEVRLDQLVPEALLALVRLLPGVLGHAPIQQSVHGLHSSSSTRVPRVVLGQALGHGLVFSCQSGHGQLQILDELLLPPPRLPRVLPVPGAAPVGLVLELALGRGLQLLAGGRAGAASFGRRGLGLLARGLRTVRGRQGVRLVEAGLGRRHGADRGVGEAVESDVLLVLGALAHAARAVLRARGQRREAAVQEVVGAEQGVQGLVALIFVTHFVFVGVFFLRGSSRRSFCVAQPAKNVRRGLRQHSGCQGPFGRVSGARAVSLLPDFTNSGSWSWQRAARLLFCRVAFRWHVGCY